MPDFGVLWPFARLPNFLRFVVPDRCELDNLPGMIQLGGILIVLQRGQG
jgi:hypothetical protein